MKLGSMAGALLSALFLISALSGGLDGQASAKKVRVNASATKPDDAGNQVITVNVKIDPGWYIYANPVDHNKETLNRNKTTLSVSPKVKLDAVKIDYPAGTLKKEDKDEYKIYGGSVTIRAAIRRAKGDTGPLEWNLEVNACNSNVCLPKGVVTFTVP